MQVSAPKLHKSQTSLQHAAAHKALAAMNRRSPALAPKPPLPPYSNQPPPINTTNKERGQVCALPLRAFARAHQVADALQPDSPSPVQVHVTSRHMSAATCLSRY